MYENPGGGHGPQPPFADAHDDRVGCNKFSLKSVTQFFFECFAVKQKFFGSIGK